MSEGTRGRIAKRTQGDDLHVKQEDKPRCGREDEKMVGGGHVKWFLLGGSWYTKLE